MILVKLNHRNLQSIAKNPLRKRGRIVRVVARIALELWALILIATCSLTLYSIYLFSQIKKPAPAWPSSIERREDVIGPFAKELLPADTGNSDPCEQVKAFSSKTSKPIPCETFSPPYVVQAPPPETPQKSVASLVLLAMMCGGFVNLMPYALEWARNTRTLAQRFTMVDAQSLLSKDTREPILYLRPFIDRYSGNDILAQPESDENLIIPIVKEIGPVITIGQPGETLPPLGAARFYVENDCDWRSTVTDYLSLSRLVVISPGYSDGVIWETSKALQVCPPEKIVISLISFKEELNYSKSLTAYESFRNAVKNSAKIELPETIGDSLFIYFDPDWTPRLAKAEASKLNSWFIEVAARDAIQKLLQRKGVRVSGKMPLGWYASNIYHLLLASVAFLILIVAIAQYLAEWFT